MGWSDPRWCGDVFLPKPFVPTNWASGIDMATGRPIENPASRYLSKPFDQLPGGAGGHSWQAMAFSPKTGLVYLPTQRMLDHYDRDRNFQYHPGHINTARANDALDLPDDPAAIAALKASTFGELIAWDPVAQQARWRVRLRYFQNGGALATAGGLVFQGNNEGRLVAYDAGSGKALWSYDTVNGIIAPPISYQLDGKQYVAVMVGSGGFPAMIGTISPDRPRLPARLMVFALDGQAKAEPYDIPVPAPVDLAGVTSSGDVKAGLAHYNYTCLVCHGFSARGSYTADLRRSQMIKTPEAFRSVVIDGALKDLGMVSFADIYTPRDVEDIRAYLIQQGRKVERQQAARPAKQ